MRAERADDTPEPVREGWGARLAQLAIWLVIAGPALYQLALLATAIAGRWGYPYDLEWMEGGMLHHAQRIRDGAGIYVPPSIDFIPYLYTPLYPSLLALLGGAFGVSYSVGRAISILALVGIAVVAVTQLTAKRHAHPRRGPALAGAVLALGLFAAAYPISDGWYDLVRADTLFLLLITTGIGALHRWATTGSGPAGHAQVAASAVILTLAFFCKQTGIIYVALGGLMLLVFARRRLPVFVATAGLLGLGGTWLLQKTSDGWFWTYVSEIHRAHDFNMDRFWKSFANILWQTKGDGYEFPVLGAPITIVVGVALVLVAASAAVVHWRNRRSPRRTLLLFFVPLFGLRWLVETKNELKTHTGMPLPSGCWIAMPIVGPLWFFWKWSKAVQKATGFGSKTAFLLMLFIPPVGAWIIQGKLNKLPGAPLESEPPQRLQLPQVRPLLIWSSAFAVSVLVGAIGWGTEFAHFNAYMPAHLHGALAAGSALPAIYACARLWWGDERPRAELVATGAALAAALPLAIVCVTARWEPAKFVPTEADVAAGDRLIERLRTIEGEVWMPSHPWYAYMAGKTPRVHRMGIKDVTARQPRTVERLEDALEHHAFTAIVLDNADLHNREHLGPLLRHYRPALKLPATEGPCPRDWICRIVKGLPVDERPRVYTGARPVPDAIWVPAIAATPPAGAKALFDFEATTWDGWKKTGTAWGTGPVQTGLPGQDIVLGATGRRFATSMHGGEAGTGRVTSPMFALDAEKLTVRLGGGTDATKLRVELYAEETLIETASVPLPGGSSLRTVTIPIPPQHRSKIGKLVFVDESPTGHLVIDDLWAWAAKPE